MYSYCYNYYLCTDKAYKWEKRKWSMVLATNYWKLILKERLIYFFNFIESH